MRFRSYRRALDYYTLCQLEWLLRCRIQPYAYTVRNNSGEVLGHSNCRELAARLAEVYRAKGMSCFVRKN